MRSARDSGNEFGVIIPGGHKTLPYDILVITRVYRTLSQHWERVAL